MILANKPFRNKLILFPVFIFLLQLLKNIRGFEKIEYVNLILLACGVIYELIKSKKTIKFNKSFFYILFLLFLVIISFFNGHDLSRTISNFSVLFLTSVYMWIKSQQVNGNEYILKVVDQLVVIFGVIAFLNLYQVFFHKPILSSFLSDNISSIKSLFGSTSYRTMSVFGNALVAGSGYLVGLIFSCYIVKNNFYKFIVSAIILIEIYTTQSRSTWISLLLIMCLIIFKNAFSGDFLSRQFNYDIVMMVPIMMIMLLIAESILYQKSFFVEIISRFGDSLSINNSTDISNLQRIGGYRLVLSNMNGFHWIFGYGNGAIEKLLVGNRIVLANFETLDNQYFTILYENGIFGIVYILIPLLVAFKRFFSNNISKYGKAIYLSCIGLYFTFFFYEGVYWNTIGMIFSIVVSGVMFFDFKKKDFIKMS